MIIHVHENCEKGGWVIHEHNSKYSLFCGSWVRAIWVAFHNIAIKGDQIVLHDKNGMVQRIWTKW